VGRPALLSPLGAAIAVTDAGLFNAASLRARYVSCVTLELGPGLEF